MNRKKWTGTGLMIVGVLLLITAYILNTVVADTVVWTQTTAILRQLAVPTGVLGIVVGQVILMN